MHGKTTLMTKLAKNFIDQGEKIFFFNGEQSKEDFKNNLFILSSSSKDLVSLQYKSSCVFDNYVNQKVAQELNSKYGDKMFIYNNEISRDINTLLGVMDEVRITKGVRVFFLDNFMQIDINSENVFQEQSNIMEKLRTYAVNKNIHIHLVAHPRKTERFQFRLSLFDVAGSSNMINKAYNVIVIMRTDNLDFNSSDVRKLQRDMINEGYDLTQSDAVLEILKTKGNRCGLVGLNYDRILKTFTPQPQLTNEAKDELQKELMSNKEAKCRF